MKPKKAELNKINLALFKAGHGSRKRIAKAIGGHPSEITRLLSGHGMAEKKYNKLKTTIESWS